jgi:pyruvate,water dikinase
MLGWIFFFAPEKALPSLTHFIAERVQWLKESVGALPDASSRLQRVLDLTTAGLPDTLFRTALPYVGSGVLTSRVLPKVAGPHADQADLDAVMSGLQGNVTTEMGLELADLADLVRGRPALEKALETLDDQPLDFLANLEGGAAFLDALKGFLRRYGMRGPGEIDISRPRYADNPALLIKVILGNQGHSERGAHRRHHEALDQQGLAAARRLEAAARKASWGFLRGPLVRRFTRVLRHTLALREHPKYMAVQILDVFRQEALQAGRRLVEEGRLDRADDVFHLEMPVLLSALQDPTQVLRPQVAQSRVALERWQRTASPRVITSEGESVVIPPNAADYPVGALIGTAVSAGTVEGVARVILDPMKEVLKQGEILVAPCTDPGWTPLFVNAAGLVMEVGGVMTHGSVVAREKGIPAVVGVPDALSRVRTGMRLRVHGSEGFVEILEA